MHDVSRSRLPIAIIAVTTAVLGACGTPGGGRGGPPGASQNPGEMGGMACQTLVDQNREAFTQTARLLVLAPPQQVLWESYEQSVRALIDESLRLETYKGARRSALAQIEDKTQAVRQRVAQMEEIGAQAKTLYLSLDDAQKVVADRNLAATVPDLYAGTTCLSANGPDDMGRSGGRPGGAGGAPR